MEKEESGLCSRSIRIRQVCEVDSALPITVVMRVYFSSYHLWAAEHLSALAEKIENADRSVPRFDIEHRTYVTNSIFSAIAFLEAAINELFQDIIDSHAGYVTTVNNDSKKLMSDFWKENEEKHCWPGVLKKYQKALTFFGKDQFDKGEELYENALLVRDLRNTLVHFQPRSLGGKVRHDLDSRLSGKFHDNKLMNGSGNPWFPDKCLGHGCAEWSVLVARAFADRFFSRIGLVPNYQRVKFTS